ncbi:MAG: hypothetical protein A4E57_00858 [Syntrophorhabdaceae bacterium PtaU1.Bin034]|nr:MAG: hypothetical protein A4E57_00858 [Syntrophorhabdaceae bacterium PtaU1.Bin034]
MGGGKVAVGQRGLNRGKGCTGTGRGRASGTGGLISGVLDLVGDLIRARKGTDIGMAGNPDVLPEKDRESRG